MIIVLDLDDTLYPEIDYVKSGFRAVCAHLEQTAGADYTKSYATMLEELHTNGRGAIFDRVLLENGLYSKKMVRECISVYRKHRPEITCYPEATCFLERFKPWKKYVVTDGNILAQRNKINALGIKEHFVRTIPSYQYGISYSKPSTACFEKILHWEKCNDPAQLVYIGDNPNKDFVGLKKMGAQTIRVLTGGYKTLKLTAAYEADHTFDSLDDITTDFITTLGHENR